MVQGNRVAFKTATNSYPSQGNRELPVTLDFSATGTLFDDIFPEMSASQIETIQSVYIDNSLNAAALSLQFLDTQITITAQPYTQGIYPVISQGALRYKATTTSGIKIPICFSNVEKKASTWGATPGVFIVPPLTNIPVNFAPLAVGDNILVNGVANTTIKVYRLLFGFGGGANIEFYSGPSAGADNLTGVFPLFAGGSIIMEPSGIAWMTTSVGANLVLNSDTASNMGGVLGYVQS